MKRIIVVLLAGLLLLSGCQTQMEDTEKYTIAYLREDGKELLSAVSLFEAEDVEEWANIVAEKFNNAEDVPEKGIPLLSDGVKIKEVSRNTGVLTIDLNSAYNSLDTARKLLVRAGLTRTYIQNPQIKAVSLKVEGESVQDSYGNDLGVMMAKTFVDESNDGINNYRSMQMTLYFTDEKKEDLISENRLVYYSVNTPIEQAVVNELISGPTQAGLFRTLPAEINVLNVTIQDDICYVNFDESFETAVTDVDPLVQIYSIVDSLAAVCKVNQVVFSVNGSSKVIVKDTLDLDQVFSPNLKEDL